MAFDERHFLLDKLNEEAADDHFLSIRQFLALPTAIREMSQIWGRSLNAMERADEDLAAEGQDPLPPYPHLLNMSLIHELLLLSTLTYLKRRGYSALAIKYVRNCILAKTAEIINEELPGVKCNFQLLVPVELERPSLPALPPPQDGDEGLHPRQG